ncbi:MAG TPA: cytochrome c [Candidatus Acidoferrales bacterium]|nr:cytochrome c [Candidatus Acidoferrales bacterium]
MRGVGLRLAVAVASLLAARTVAAQGQRMPSSWTTATVAGEGQPTGFVEYQKYCSMCHGEGVGRPGTLALQAKYKGAEPALLEKRTDLTTQLIKTYVRNGVSVMPFFRKTEISDAELDAIAAYLTRNKKP